MCASLRASWRRGSVHCKPRRTVGYPTGTMGLRPDFPSQERDQRFCIACLHNLCGQFARCIWKVEEKTRPKNSYRRPHAILLTFKEYRRKIVNLIFKYGFLSLPVFGKTGYVTPQYVRFGAVRNYSSRVRAAPANSELRDSMDSILQASEFGEVASNLQL